MAQVLYRKYRSQDFSQIFGQEPIKKVLMQALNDEKVAHAYLFTGPRGTGKTSMARILAKALNCSDRRGSEPCNKCTSCVAINEFRFMDLIEIDAASNRGIDEIRDLKEKVGFLPVQGVYKVYIIDEVHMLTSEAFNALLKTLEEPPSNVVFILATTEIHKLPQTIISRTQRFDFKPASNAELMAKLSFILKNEGIKFETEALEVIIETAGGSFRDAETILEKILSSTGYKQDKVINIEDVSQVLGLAASGLVDDLIESTSTGNVEKAFAVIEKVQTEGIDFNQYIKQLLLKARYELTQNIGGDISTYSLKFLFTFIKEVSIAYDKIKNSPLPSLPLEMAILNIVELLGLNSGEKSVERAKGRSKKPAGALVSESTDVKVSHREENEIGTDERILVKKEEATVSDGVESSESSSTKELLFEDVVNSWGGLINKAKENNPHLAALLVTVVLKSINGSHLQVEVPFKFHQKQLENKRVRSIFENMSREVFGSALILDVVVNESLVELGDLTTEKDEAFNDNIIEEVFSELL